MSHLAQVLKDSHIPNMFSSTEAAKSNLREKHEAKEENNLAARAALQEAVSGGMMGVVEAIKLMLPEERERLQKLQGELSRMHLEVQSLAHQRTVIEVLSRPIMHSVKSAGRQLQDAQYRQLRRNKANNGAEEGGRGFVAGVRAGELDACIHIPSYRQASAAPTSSGARAGAGGPRVYARGVGGRTLLPSQSPGLPLELRQLKTQPQPIAIAKRPRRRKTGGSYAKSDGLFPLAHSLEMRYGETKGELQRLRSALHSTNEKIGRERQRSLKKIRVIARALGERQDWKDRALLHAVEEVVREGVGVFGEVMGEVELLDLLGDILESTPLVELEEELFEYEREREEEIWRREDMEREEERETEVEHAYVPPRKGKEERENEVPLSSAALTTADIAVQVEEQVREIEIQSSPPSTPPRPPAPPSAAPLSLPPALPPQVVLQLPPDFRAVAGVEQLLVQLMGEMVSLGGQALGGQQELLLALLQRMPPLHLPPSDTPPPASAVSLPPQEEGEEKEVQTDETEERDEAEDAVVKEEDECCPPLSSPYVTAMGEVLLGGRGLPPLYQASPRNPLPLHWEGEAEGGRRRVSPPILRFLWEKEERERAKKEEKGDEESDRNREKEGKGTGERVLQIAEQFLSLFQQSLLSPKGESLRREEVEEAVRKAVGSTLLYGESGKKELKEKKGSEGGAVVNEKEKESERLKREIAESKARQREVLEKRREAEEDEEDSVEGEEFLALFPPASHALRKGGVSSSLSSSSSFSSSAERGEREERKIGEESYDAQDLRPLFSLPAPLHSSLFAHPATLKTVHERERGRRGGGRGERRVSPPSSPPPSSSSSNPPSLQSSTASLPSHHRKAPPGLLLSLNQRMKNKSLIPPSSSLLSVSSSSTTPSLSSSLSRGGRSRAHRYSAHTKGNNNSNHSSGVQDDYSYGDRDSADVSDTPSSMQSSSRNNFKLAESVSSTGSSVDKRLTKLTTPLLVLQNSKKMKH